MTARQSPQVPQIPKEKQKQHAKLYKDYEDGKKLNELASDAGESVIRKGNFPPKRFGTSASCNTASYLQSIACDADAIVVGTLRGGVSQPTEENYFIFTDYELSVSSVIKDNPHSPIQPSGNLIVSRPGGEITINGRTVRAIDQFFEPFQTDTEYLLFLKFIPTTNAYRAYRSGSFSLTKGKANKLATEKLPDNLGNNTDVAKFLAEITAIANTACLSSCSNAALY